MLVLGLDPGTATTGYGLINFDRNDFDIVEYGLIETHKDETASKRLSIIHSEVIRIINSHNPEVIAIEKVFFFSNAKTVIKVGQAIGVMMLAAAHTGRQIFEYSPAMVKKSISGNGRADKKMVQQSLRKILGPKVRSQKRKKTHFDNAADALAIALCHALQTSIIPPFDLES